MQINYKILGQVSPVSGSLTTLYTVPASTSAVCSTLAVTCLGSSTAFRVALRPSGSAIANQHYIVYDATCNQYDSVFLTLGVTLAATDVVSVYSGASSASFSLFGSEFT